MKQQLLQHLEDPASLEKLYRSDKSAFRKAFEELYPDVAHLPMASFWHHRLLHRSAPVLLSKRNDLLFILGLALVTTFLVKLPALTSMQEDVYYPRNISFILFTALLVYFSRKHQLSVGKIVGWMAILAAEAVFINWLPAPSSGSTFLLSCIHLPLFTWALLGYVYTGAPSLQRWQGRPGFLRYNGDVIILGSLMTSGVGALSALTIGLFNLIGLDVTSFYFNWIFVVELSACPLVATYILDINPNLISKVSPIIARIFSPLVLVTLVAYLFGIAWAKKDPFNDRDFLLLFNMLLIGVLAIIFFSLIEMPRSSARTGALLVTLLLSVVTIIVNSIALAAILYRISSWGFTPNRLAVLGGNLLFFIHLIMIGLQLFFQYRRRQVDYERIEKVISGFLPVYACWALVVAVVIPFLFRFS